MGNSDIVGETSLAPTDFGEWLDESPSVLQ